VVLVAKGSQIGEGPRITTISDRARLALIVDPAAHCIPVRRSTQSLVVPRAPGVGRRQIDGLIVLGQEKRRLPRGGRTIDIAGRDVVIAPTNSSMTLAFFLSAWSQTLLWSFDQYGTSPHR
jgi:hypothetical protein